MSVYIALRMGAQKPWKLTLWEIVFRTGWTWDYVTSLSLDVIHEHLQVVDGMNKAKR